MIIDYRLLDEYMGEFRKIFLYIKGVYWNSKYVFLF